MKVLERARGFVPSGKPTKADAIAGVTTGVANVPDGMASAVLAGVNPVYGIYTLIIGTPIAAMTVSTQLMMFNTTSAMTLVAVDGLGGRTGDDRVHALIIVALIAGLVQIVLGALGLGMVTKFVPNSVMTGFLTGIAATIILGQLWDFFGYSDDLGGTKLEKTARLLGHFSEIDYWTTAIGVLSIAIMIALGATRLANFNLLIALGIASLVTWALSPDSVVLVKSLGEIPRALPSIEVPKLGLMPEMLFAGVAVAIVGLLQAAGVAQAYPNPDGSETDDSRDFLGQGIGNTAGSFFNCMAGGGSLSGTALLVGAGAMTRYASVIQAGVVLVVVLVFSNLLSLIPMTALAALLIYAAALSIKFNAIYMVQRTSRTSLLSMILTLLATLLVPLQQAVAFGVVVAAVLFIYRASIDIRVSELIVVDDRLAFNPPPSVVRSEDVVLLDIEGNLFYAGARTLQRLLPETAATNHPVVVLRLHGQRELGSTFFRVVGDYSDSVRAQHGRLILAGVEPGAMAGMERTGMIDKIGTENIFPTGSVMGDSVLEAYRRGREWLATVQLTPPAPISDTEPTTGTTPT